MNTHEVEVYRGHTIVYDKGDTSWGAYVEDLPVCVAVGNTLNHVRQKIHLALMRHQIALELDQHERPWLYEDQAEQAHA